MRFLLVVLGLLPSLVQAEDWQRLLDDEAVTAAIADRTIVYDAHTMQWFGASGDTQYVTDRMADGRWAARGGQYCSTWPPSDSCFLAAGVFRAALMIGLQGKRGSCLVKRFFQAMPRAD